MTTKNSIMLTGSRDVDRDTAQNMFERHLSGYLSQGRIWVLATGRGIDHRAMEWLLENGERCWAVVAYTRLRQPRWVQPWLDELDRVIELDLPKRKTAGMIRNRHMVDLSEVVYGFWVGRGGDVTKTLKYAIRQRRETHALPIDDGLRESGAMGRDTARGADLARDSWMVK